MSRRTSLSVHALDVPLASPFRIAYDVVTEVRNGLVIAQADGVRGFGESAPVATITGEDRPSGLKAFEAWQRDGGRVPADARDPAGLRIPSISMRAAVEGALLDLAAREAGKPLCTYLTGRAPAPVPTSITLGLGDDKEVVPWVDRQVAAGFRILKVKGGLGVERDLARIKAVREAAGPKVTLRVDPNQAWTLEETKQALPKLRDLGVAALEQPLKKDDLVGHAALVREQQVPIMLDESVFSPDDARRALAAKACDWINIKLQKCGGIGPGLAIADLAQAAGVPCMVGCMVESRVGILTAGHLVLAHPNIQAADLDGHTFLKSDPVAGGGVIANGKLAIGTEHGLGVRDVVHGAPLATLAAIVPV
ncbi:MAG: dipeptide epimerase [Candidatus Thermoplasmatota archaeon]|jgi:L-alanine-DL-glutamate epimerase-like enolase superfamily enzyme